MGKGNFTEDFKLDAIKQITERGYSVADVSQRLGVSTHSLYGWIKRYAASPGWAVFASRSKSSFQAATSTFLRNRHFRARTFFQLRFQIRASAQLRLWCNFSSSKFSSH